MLEPTHPRSGTSTKDPCACGQVPCGRGEEFPHACIAVADAQLEQAAAFVRSIPVAAYSRTCALASGATIGKHLRHCLDHYAAAIGGATRDRDAEPIDYDHRDRDVPMETSVAAALAAIETLRADLAKFTRADIDAPVAVRHMVDGDGTTVHLGSTLGRELAFAAHHALHHHAIMKIIADAFGCITPAGFGKAPSTVHHERTTSAILTRSH